MRTNQVLCFYKVCSWSSITSIWIHLFIYNLMLVEGLGNFWDIVFCKFMFLTSTQLWQLSALIHCLNVCKICKFCLGGSFSCSSSCSERYGFLQGDIYFSMETGSNNNSLQPCNAMFALCRTMEYYSSIYILRHALATVMLSVTVQ